ncbi:Tim44 domain-containing protein [Undibacterium piscinae]|uniref:Tim44 domain-containing protein n=1 Tax=Undibacterium piscinae TaxID=2495591 RepID=A0A6M4A6P7_9BURK|nr:Tim44 domain-containing protein [Undibacterium piscinae]
MKKFLVAMMMVASAMAITVSDVEAKRLGSGGSVGRQSNNVTRQAAPATPSQAKPAAAPAAAPAATPPKPAGAWKGIVGGLIGGALLGAMFSSMGLGSGLASALGSILPMLLLGGLAFFLFRMYQNRKGGAAPAAFSQPSYAGVPASSTALPEIGSRIEPQSFQSGAASFGSAAAANAGSADQGTWSVPADFDVPGFLRNAKTYYIRLQASWDRADINDIREFTSPEMFAEIKMQIQERGTQANVTDVVTIDAELLGLETLGNEHLASVKFTGMIKEDANAPAEAFKEVWNLTKPLNGQGGWTLAGIQQL